MEEDLEVLLDPMPEQKESTPSDLEDILTQKLENALHKATQAVIEHEVAKIASEHSAVDLAFAASRLPPSARSLLFRNLSNVQEQIKFLINTDTTTRIAVFREVTDQEIVAVIAHMPSDEAVEVLEDLSERRYRKILDDLEPNKAMRIREIEKNARNTAGRLMTNEFFSFPMEAAIGQVALTIRNNPGIDLTRRIFVLNQEGELQGYVPARNLIVNPSDMPLKKVMRPIHHKVFADATREHVVELVERYKISALPVVNHQDQLIGVITYEDVLDAMEDIIDATIGSVAGTAEKLSEHESFMRRFVARSPWLFVTLCAGLVNMWVMSSFMQLEKKFLTFVLFFVPLITGMSGNIGIQCSTILVRGMALGQMSFGNRRGAMLRELRMGLMAGLIFGTLCGLVVYWMQSMGFARIEGSPLAIGSIVSVGLFGACFAGTLLGVFSPFFFFRVGVDPAVASGPIITAFNDFLSMSIYFLIAMGMSAALL